MPGTTRVRSACLGPRIHSGNRKPTFELNEDSIGVGMGIHGEQGVGIEKMMSADELAVKMVELVLADDLPIGEGDEVLVFINSLGSTTMMECLIVLKKVKTLLVEKGVNIYDVLLGPLVTCQEMAGISLSLTKMNDTETSVGCTVLISWIHKIRKVISFDRAACPQGAPLYLMNSILGRLRTSGPSK